MSGTKEEFRSAIQQQLRNDGILDEITARIRSRILLSVLNNEHGPTASARTDETNSQSVALLSLLYHFLEKNQFIHTLPVFAAEGKFERSPPLPLFDAIRELGLHVIWDKYNKRNQFLTTDILSLLQGVAHTTSLAIEAETKLIVNSDTVGVSKAIQTDVELLDHTQMSKSIQTDVEWTPRTCSDGSRELDNKKDNRSGYCNESLILAIERECQERMTHEMNEKLRLSEKTQAAQATRRLERKHNEELQSLRGQFEAERRQSQVQHDALNEKLTKQLLEKSSLQKEMDLLNERVKEMQKQRYQEWTDEHEMLQRKARDTMAQLDSEKRNVQTHLHVVDTQKEAMREKEAQLKSLTEENSILIAEIVDLRHSQKTSLEAQKCTQVEFQKHLAAMQEKYSATRADLHASKEEVASLLALLRQSQKAIESISFREIGALNVRSQPSAYRRDSMRPVSQLGARAQPKPEAEIVSLPRHSLARPRDNCHVASLPPPALNYSKQTPLNHVQGRTLSHPPKNENSHQHMSSNVTKCIHSAVDPPCCSFKDPPETELKLDGRWRESHHMINVGNQNKHIHADSSMDNNFVGKDIVLDLSFITEHTQQENLAAPNTVQIALSSEATNPKTSSLEQSSLDGRDVVAMGSAIENIASVTKTLTESLPKSEKCENVEEEGVEPDNNEATPSEHRNHEAFVAVCSLNEKTGLIVANAQQATTTVDSGQYSGHFQLFDEADPIPANSAHQSSSMLDAEEYSEHFQSFDEDNCKSDNFNPLFKRPVRGGDDVSVNVSNPGSPASASSDGYSESFCSLAKNENEI
jgi:hypothetical protein